MNRFQVSSPVFGCPSFIFDYQETGIVGHPKPGGHWQGTQHYIHLFSVSFIASDPFDTGGNIISLSSTHFRSDPARLNGKGPLSKRLNGPSRRFTALLSMAGTVSLGAK